MTCAGSELTRSRASTASRTGSNSGRPTQTSKSTGNRLMPSTGTTNKLNLLERCRLHKNSRSKRDSLKLPRPYGALPVLRCRRSRLPQIPSNPLTLEVFSSCWQEIEEFDTTVSGPWMRRWEIVHVNQHTNALDVVGDGVSWHAKP